MGEHYGVLKHVAGAIMHEPVPYSTPSHPSNPSEASQMLAAAAYDESQTRPRLPTF
jgi:hypothetical protein